MTTPKRKTPYISYGVFLAISVIVTCYLLRPELLGPRKAFSSLGAYPPTSYIFNIGFVAVAVLILLDIPQTKSLFQKITRVFAALGFAGLGIFQIEHGALRGNLHRLSGLVMLLAIIASMIGDTIVQWKTSSTKRKLSALAFTSLGLLSVTMSILSSSQFKVIALQGLAQYIGLVSFIGWAILDNRET